MLPVEQAPLVVSLFRQIANCELQIVNCYRSAESALL